MRKWLLSIAAALLLLWAVPVGNSPVTEVQAAVTVKTPALVSAKASGTSKIKLTWKKPGSVTGYRIYRKTDGTGWKAIKTLSGSNTVSYTDSGLKPGVRYIYTVKAYKKPEGGTVWSGYDKKGIFAVTGMDAPKFRVGVSTKEDCAVVISITPAPGSVGSVIYRKSGSETKWTRIGVTKGKSYADRTLKKGVTCTYTVRSYQRYSGVTYYGKYDTKGQKCLIKPENAGFLKLKNFVTKKGYLDSEGNRFVGESMEEQGYQFLWTIAYIKSKNIFEFMFATENKDYYDAMVMYLRPNPEETSIEYGLAFKEAQAGFFATLRMKNRNYRGSENMTFTVKENTAGIPNSDIQEPANEILRLGFTGWQEILTQGAGVPFGKLGFESLNI